jgi:hypothetical protein
MLDPIREEIRNLRRELQTAVAKRDRAALERIYAEEYVFIHGFGYVDDRSAHIEDLLSTPAGGILPGRRPTSSDPPNQFFLYGNVAIVRSRRPLNGVPIISTEVWAKSDGRWRVIQNQTTELQPARTFVSVSPDVLDKYVGQYDQDRGSWVVTREGGTLVLRGSVYAPRVLKPISESQFFDKVGGEWTFNRDSSGKVTEVVLRPPRGEQVKATKRK